MDEFFLNPDTYAKYKEKVFELSNSIQVDVHEHLGEGRKRAMSDPEIADELGLDLRTVQEIRCIAERDAYPLEEFGWSALFSLRIGDRKWIAAPRPERYDLDRDPAEKRNLAGLDPQQWCHRGR